MNPHGLLRLDLNQVRLPFRHSRTCTMHVAYFLPINSPVRDLTSPRACRGVNCIALVICRQMGILHGHLEGSMTKKLTHGAKIDTFPH